MRKIFSPTTLQLLLIGCLLSCTTNTYAQPFSVRSSTGVVHLSLSDWSKFSSGLPNAFYTKNNPNLYYGVSFHYALNSDHSINTGTELIRSSASWSDTFSVVSWKFQGIPLFLGYEYRILTFNEHFTPVAGLGISYFISEVNTQESFFNQTLKRTGNGYGIHISLGLLSQLTTSLSMISQVRYRYSDGMAFSGNKDDIKVEFSGIDFSVGLEWTF
ncbi:MAG: outer membrane beta-barrel protein [Bacteroidales bacterium]|nr:OmpW family outer membrane protein [Bacteroidales bacterium]MDZ4203259.1 outer membrane beta-barrel protein [Bacteroidales bacterium]